mmetsp:Transcript_45013/g.86036  ORF Transcript_45013/g.86036 Transcript_45013/m.86036 type:complete len:242 (-) Transcript_45013:15-740(-)
MGKEEETTAGPFGSPGRAPRSVCRGVVGQPQQHAQGAAPDELGQGGDGRREAGALFPCNKWVQAPPGHGRGVHGPRGLFAGEPASLLPRRAPLLQGQALPVSGHRRTTRRSPGLGRARVDASRMRGRAKRGRESGRLHRDAQRAPHLPVLHAGMVRQRGGLGGKREAGAGGAGTGAHVLAHDGGGRAPRRAAPLGPQLHPPQHALGAAGSPPACDSGGVRGGCGAGDEAQFGDGDGGPAVC